MLIINNKFISFLLLLWFFTIQNALGSAAETNIRKPNILLILADDIGTGDVPGYWDTNQVDMPNLQSLISNGVTFTDAHSTPLCASSRYALLSGNYQHRGRRFMGTFRLNYMHSQFYPEQQSIAQVLHDQGNYHTAMMGKWHLGGKVPTNSSFTPTTYEVTTSRILHDDRHDWSQRLEGGPGDIGFNYSYITAEGIQRAPFAFIRDDYLDIDQSEIKYWEVGKYDMPHGESMIDKEAGDGAADWDSTAFNQILVNETEQFLDHHFETRPNDPFFAYVALGAVHLPQSPPRNYIDGTPIAGTQPTAHMDLIAEIDKVVGSLTQQLVDRNLLEETIIIFTSDNGGLGNNKGSPNYNSNGPKYRGRKGQIWEGGHRIPLIMRWDGQFPKGERRSHLVGLNDLFATLCEIVGVQIPNGQAIDSVDFSRYIYSLNETENLRDHLGVWQYKYDGRLYEESIRMDKYKLIKKYKRGSKPRLYDLETDISETNNIAKSNRLLVKKMYKKLKKIGACHDDRRSFKVRLESGDKMITTCSWFKMDKVTRCSQYPQGRKRCRRTCTSEANECTYPSDV